MGLDWPAFARGSAEGSEVDGHLLGEGAMMRVPGLLVRRLRQGWQQGRQRCLMSVTVLMVGTLLLVSDQAYQASWNLAVAASATAAVACIRTWTTDFRDDLPNIDVPMLVIHGDADQVLLLDKTAQRLPGLVKDTRLVVVEGGPHAIAWTHAD
jgi:pimeloyl-ACP methyl ester carboxylesterase